MDQSLVHPNNSPAFVLCRAQGCIAGPRSAGTLPPPCSGIFLPQVFEAAARKSRWARVVTKVPLAAARNSPGEAQAPWQGGEGLWGRSKGLAEMVRAELCPGPAPTISPAAPRCPGCCCWASSRLVQQAGERKQPRRAALMTRPRGMP